MAKTVRAYESRHDLIDYIENTWDPAGGNVATISKYDYTNNGLGLRTGVAYSGQAFGSPSPAIGQSFGYNERYELTSSDRNDTVPADWAYTYDNIGNRIDYTTDGSTVTDYVSNQLNQYDRWDRPSGVVGRERYTYDEDGNLVQSWVAGDMNCDGVVDFGDVNAFQMALSSPGTYAQQYPNCDIMNGDINGDGNVDFGDINPFTALQSTGNTAVARTFTWNGENRLISVAPTYPAAGDRKIAFVYDYQGRRVARKVWTYDEGVPQWTPTAEHKYVWDGWLMLVELDGMNDDAVLRKYTWGLDLAGMSGSTNSLESAGGIGGLLAVEQPPQIRSTLNCVYFYDGNGNVGQVVEWDPGLATPSGAWGAARLSAAYEYDPYGGITAQTGWLAATNPFRFSTKQYDEETGLGYWGYRYYSPALGRWMSRDPIGLRGSMNIYVYAANQGNEQVDPFGLSCFCIKECTPGDKKCTIEFACGRSSGARARRAGSAVADHGTSGRTHSYDQSRKGPWTGTAPPQSRDCHSGRS